MFIPTDPSPPTPIILNENQWAIMEILWDDHELSDAELLEHLQQMRGFKGSVTDFDLCIAELEAKDVIRRVRCGRKVKLLPSITLEQACQSTAQHLIHTLPSGAILPLVLILVQRFDLSQGLKQQIRNLLETVMARES